MNRRLLLLAVSMLGVVIAFGAIATPAQAGTATPLPGVNHVRSVFQENGFRPFKATPVRCYSDGLWSYVTRGDRFLMGFYLGGAWIHVRDRVCNNAAKAVRGQVNSTNAVALATIVHETIHRQGVDNEARTECLSQWLTGHVVKHSTGSSNKGLLAKAYTTVYAKRNLPARYQMSTGACTRLAGQWGVQTIGDSPAPPPPTTNPPSPEPPPVRRLPLSNRCQLRAPT